ncbi:MAG: biotin--[acetyl-CoA-carboxylase] ligase [Rhizobiales bacterium]|nr:biotin--[acetyl-CoA-carboxylase] ligase [Hyphomicrobiales bacterium]NRB12853.1 biotin--[acetyl-CoA-carboxylase] ligase [Hyphomicrobiales bacterium]
MVINLPNGYTLAHYDQLGSTNEQALLLAAELDDRQLDEQHGIVVFTQNQSAGRGRSGRTWLSSEQTLTATILISTHAPKDKVAQVAFVMAVAVHKTIADLLPADKQNTIGLKWPNDVLVRGHKLCGILIESQLNKFNKAHILAVGIGMNVGEIPQDGDFSAMSLAQMGIEVDVETVLSALCHNFAKFFEQWSNGRNFVAIRKIWLNHALGLGGKITARLPNRSIQGIFESLDDDGTLILRDEADEIHQITAGDIFIGHI